MVDELYLNKSVFKNEKKKKQSGHLVKIYSNIFCLTNFGLSVRQFSYIKYFILALSINV